MDIGIEFKYITISLEIGFFY